MIRELSLDQVLSDKGEKCALLLDAAYLYQGTAGGRRDVRGHPRRTEPREMVSKTSLQ